MRFRRNAVYFLCSFCGPKGKIIFVCIAMCSLVMSLCSHDLLMTSLSTIITIAINSGLTYTVPGKTSICFYKPGVPDFLKLLLSGEVGMCEYY